MDARAVNLIQWWDCTSRAYLVLASKVEQSHIPFSMVENVLVQILNQWSYFDLLLVCFSQCMYFTSLNFQSVILPHLLPFRNLIRVALCKCSTTILILVGTGVRQILEVTFLDLVITEPLPDLVNCLGII